VKYQVRVGNRSIEVEIDGARIRCGGAEYDAELRSVPGTPLRLLISGDSSRLYAMDFTGDRWEVQERGERHLIEVVDERTAHIRSLVGTGAAAGGPTALRAPMPGLVVRVPVNPGERVTAGASLVVLEAMKMENELKAAADGVVEAVAVAPGQVVEKGQILLSFAPAPPEPAKPVSLLT
jgi:biotin carboxyl carrier protein